MFLDANRKLLKVKAMPMNEHPPFSQLRPFNRFKTAIKAILSVPKEAVTQEEKRRQAEREAARLARRSQRPA